MVPRIAVEHRIHLISMPIVALVGALLLSACALTQTTGNPTVQQGQEWEADLVSKSKQDGELNLVADKLLRPVLDEFERKFGLTVVTGPATGSAILDQLAAERSAGRYLLDIHIGSIGTAG